MKAMKFRVESPEHSRQIQERLFEMGYSWGSTGKNISEINNNYILAYNGYITACDTEGYFDLKPYQETTLQDIQWQPKQGEIIKVSDDGKDWIECRFIGMDYEHFICKHDCSSYKQFKHARPINTIQRDIDELQAKIDELKKKL